MRDASESAITYLRQSDGGESVCGGCTAGLCPCPQSCMRPELTRNAGVAASDEWAIKNAALEAAAQDCEQLALLMEQGAGEKEPGHRLRQAARMIRERQGKPAGVRE